MSDTQAISGVIRTKWLNIRRKRFWAIVLVLLYTLLGFFVVPDRQRAGFPGDNEKTQHYLVRDQPYDRVMHRVMVNTGR